MPAQLKDGIDNVLVMFDREDATYLTGTDLSGEVLVICNETTAVRGIVLKITGKMTIQWRKVINDSLAAVL